MIRRVAWILLLPIASCARSLEGSVLPSRHVSVVAHRGYTARAPDNTLAAIRRAIDVGCDYVEIDVRQSKDGTLVMFHGTRVDRQTDGHGAVADLTLAQIRELRICSWYAFGRTCERVSTFAEGLDLCAGRIGILVDLKAGRPADVVEALRAHGMIANAIVFDSPERMPEYRRLSPELRLQASAPRTVSGVERLDAEEGPESLEASLDDWRPDLVEAAHEAGMEVWVDVLGSEDSDANIVRAFALGADAIQTNRPESVLRFSR